MNKQLFFIFIFNLLSLEVWAAGPVTETVIVLDEQNALGERIDREVVIIKGGQVYVNREQLTPSEIITQSAHITQIASFSSSMSNTACSTGSYLHILKKDKLLKKEKGCLSSERYKFLKKQFRALKKDHVTN